MCFGADACAAFDHAYKLWRGSDYSICNELAGDCVRAGCYDACAETSSADASAEEKDSGDGDDASISTVMEQDIFVTGIDANDIDSEDRRHDLVRDLAAMYKNALEEWVALTAVEAVEGSAPPQIKVTYRIKVPVQDLTETEERAAATPGAIRVVMESAAKGGLNTNMVRAFMQIKGGCEVGISVSDVRKVSVKEKEVDSKDVVEVVSAACHVRGSMAATLLAVILAVALTTIT
eukprot:g4690.t1